MLRNKAWITGIQKRSHLTACDMSFTYIKSKSGPKLDPWGTPQDMDAD